MIVIATPTGQIGRHVLHHVLTSDKRVRVIARDRSRLTPQAREHVEVVEGSTSDAAVVGEALAGADAVFWLVPPDPGADSLPEHVIRFVGPLCAAIGEHHVGRVVAVSSLGRGVAKHAGQISAIFAMDDLVESTGVDYRSLQPPGFMENLLWQVDPIRHQGTFFGPQSPQRTTPACSSRDIASMAARLLLDDSWSGQQDVPLLGPEDLSPDDMARIISDTLGRPVRYQQVPADRYKATLVEHGMSAPWAQGLLDMAAASDRGIYDGPPRTPESTMPTTFRQWCEEVLRPAVEAA